YLALSYVWGPASDQPHCTTRANFATYVREGIDSKTLPQTIRDAIHVVRALGYRYLWLDSLCIIQNSTKDKHREMVRMRHVYRDAALTIVAASATRAGEGFLHERPSPPSVALPIVVGPSTQLQVGTVHLTDRPRPGSGEPIDKRAWCLQEVLMSPRSLIFTSRTLVYRCQTTTVKVGGAFHSTDQDMLRLPSLLHAQRSLASDSASSTRPDLRRAWCKIVEEYSRRSLSFPADKLVACAGLAEEFHRVLGSTYLAGLWRGSLLNDLLWKVIPLTGPPSTRAVQYRAPSWSWASVDGAIAYTSVPAGPSRLLAHVLECTATLGDELLPFGQVTSGLLVLR
ncbi:heterokaryon incompatibility protein-domain-containing protein, partial [Trametes polyzona]